MIDRAFCRTCIAAGSARLNVVPTPSPLQASKWEAARKAKGLLAERKAKIERHAQGLEV